MKSPRTAPPGRERRAGCCGLVVAAAIILGSAGAIAVLALLPSVERRWPSKLSVRSSSVVTTTVVSTVSPPRSVPTTTALSSPPPGAALYSSGDLSYAETITGCEPPASLSDVVAAHRSGMARASAEALARARYAPGLPFLQAQDDTQLGVWFTGAGDSFDGVASRFETAVHEGAHIWSFKRFDMRKQAYPIRDGLTIEARRLNNFHRSAILAHHPDAKADSYATTYLEGQSGAQGFNTLLDEYNAYAHSLASRYCTRDTVPQNSRVSARDGMLTFMFYVATYLKIARTQHPKDYEAILADPGHRQVILTVWDRAEYWLRKSHPVPALGISDERIRAWAYTPEALQEISLVRDKEKASAAR